MEKHTLTHTYSTHKIPEPHRCSQCNCGGYTASVIKTNLDFWSYNRCWSAVYPNCRYMYNNICDLCRSTQNFSIIGKDNITIPLFKYTVKVCTPKLLARLLAARLQPVVTLVPTLAAVPPASLFSHYPTWYELKKKQRLSKCNFRFYN